LHFHTQRDTLLRPDQTTDRENKMATVTITITPHDEASDPDDDTGLTEAAFDEVMDALSAVADDIKIQRS
jgi:hypothetical protein